MSTPALAHALPESIGAVPLGIVLAVVFGAFLTTGAIATRRARAPAPAAAAPAGVEAAAARAPGWARLAGRATGVVGLGVIAVLAVAGHRDPTANLADAAVLSLLWGAVLLSSALVGAWWPAVDPVRTLAAAVDRLAGTAADDPVRAARLARVDERVRTAVPVALLVAWAWAQVAAVPSNARFQALLLGHVVLHVAAAVRFGAGWLDAAEPLTVASRTTALLTPRGRGPLDRLAGMADGRRLRWVCGVLIGWSLADLVLETSWWHDQAGGAPLAAGAVVVACTLGIGALVDGTAARFGLGPTFVAVAGGWVAAHYVSVLLIEGQGLAIWLSDPLATGADLLGRRDALVDLEPLPLGVMAALQSIPFVGGHLLGVLVAQRRAVAAVGGSAGRAGQATFAVRGLVGVLLLTGTYLQMGGV